MHVLAHSLQCAAILHDEHPDDPELVAAGLVHDVADAVYADHDDHDTRGAALVAPLLGRRVAKLVASHVAAKRYLVTKEGSYQARLSGRSVETLTRQGGVLAADEMRELEHDADFAAIIALRRADEQAKDPHARVTGLDSWRARLEELTHD